jgi:hypothetical protein
MAQKTQNLWAAMRAPFWKRFGIGKTLPANIDYAFDNDFALTWRNAAGTSDVPAVKVNANDRIEFGAAMATIGTDVTLGNAIAVNGENAAGNGSYAMLRLSASDIVTLPNSARCGIGVFSAGKFTRTITAATLATAGVEAYTAAQLLGGLIVRDTAGAPRADTMPTAAALVAAIPGAVVGDTLELIIHNNSGAANAITVTPPDAAVTVVGTATVDQNAVKRILVRLTNVTAAAEAYTVYMP